MQAPLARIILCVALLAVFRPVFAQEASKDLRFDGLVDVEESRTLAGKPLVMQLMNGTVLPNLEVVAFLKDRRSDSIPFFQYKDGTRKAKIKTEDIYRLIIDGRLYRFRYHRPSRGRFLIDQDQSRQEALARISGQDRELREPQMDDELKQAVANQITLFHDAIEKFKPTQLQISESDFAIVLTDYPQAAANQLAEQVDAMCQQMNVVFGLPENSNIWIGKMMIAAMSSREAAGKFESEVLGNKNFGTVGTWYHASPKQYLVVTQAKQLDRRLLSTIADGMAGAYARRYRSNVPMPKWVIMGMQGMLKERMFPNPTLHKAKQAKLAATQKRVGSLRGILEATKLEDHRHPLATMLVEHLIQTDPAAFSQFYEDLKLGHSMEDALRLNFGATPEQFAADFGRKVGAPGLKP